MSQQLLFSCCNCQLIDGAVVGCSWVVRGVRCVTSRRQWRYSLGLSGRLLPCRRWFRALSLNFWRDLGSGTGSVSRNSTKRLSVAQTAFWNRNKVMLIVSPCCRRRCCNMPVSAVDAEIAARKNSQPHKNPICWQLPWAGNIVNWCGVIED